ncbi:ribosome-associated protein [Alkalispirochaeta americana]|uniref:Ribosomal silencing factor RsfS n=1 Tax=Alkalispirochaeta americana TaxID=159291 RepID=A0A1N6R085_9SPIO|nr:ribosome silencing factor [Alkalispirochaeta americana]SIQ22265.1 ribosome-associated protein [Alkalispirochaeta americana]
MEEQYGLLDSSSAAREVARFLDELGATDVIALDISSQSAFTDAFVIAEANSRGQLQGFQRQVEERLFELGLLASNHRKRGDESGWYLIDCGSVIVHLMLQEQREFYGLERLWYDATVLWKEGNTPGQEGEKKIDQGAEA